MLARPNARMADKVRELVWLQLASGRCAVERVAGPLGMDRRTLHRRLALGSIADMLGFSSLSVFSRWFHGRFGISPTA